MDDLIKFDPKTQIRECDKSGIDKFVYQSILKCYALAGQQVNESDVSINIKQLVMYLNESCSRMDVCEIDRAFQNGLTGKYGKWFGLNFVTFVSWINEYRESHERKLYQQSKIDKDIKMIENHSTLTDREKEEMMVKGVLSKYNKWKSTGSFDDFGNSSYLFLERLGFINLTNDEKRAWFSRAQEEIVRELNNKPGGLSQKYALKKIIDAVLNLDPTELDRIKSKARNLVLEDYFQQIEFSGQDLAQIFNDHPSTINYYQTY